MKRFLTKAIFLFAILMASTGTTTAGVTAEKLENAGYFCFNDGPSNWVHCLRAEKFGFQSIPVKVFSEDGRTFLGTELLLRFDIYNGQPCPQDELEEWTFLEEPPYYACHHFHTGHHE